MSAFQQAFSQKREKQQLVNFSVKAQDFMAKQSVKTTDDIGISKIAGSVDSTNAGNSYL